MTLVQRELFESSLQSAHTVLELMGLPPAQATAITQRFRTHNIALADRMYPHHKDRAKFIAVAREGRNQFAEQMARERQESAAMNAAGVEYPGYSGIAEGERRGGAEDAPEVEKQTSNR